MATTVSRQETCGPGFSGQRLEGVAGTNDTLPAGGLTTDAVVLNAGDRVSADLHLTMLTGS